MVVGGFFLKLDMGYREPDMDRSSRFYSLCGNYYDLRARFQRARMGVAEQTVARYEPLQPRSTPLVDLGGYFCFRDVRICAGRHRHSFILPLKYRGRKPADGKYPLSSCGERS